MPRTKKPTALENRKLQIDSLLTEMLSVFDRRRDELKLSPYEQAGVGVAVSKGIIGRIDLIRTPVAETDESPSQPGVRRKK
jgi:hypothetical protein